MKISFSIYLFIAFFTLQGLSAQMTDNAVSLGIDTTFGDGLFGGGVSFVDFNNDGWDDLTFATEFGDSILFYVNNQGTGFTKIPSLVNHTGFSKQVLWVDTDNDGDLDFFVSTSGVSTSGGQNRFYENTGNLTLVDRTATCGLLIRNDISYGASFGDIDGDGDLDLFVSNRQTTTYGNTFYRNIGNNTFVDMTLSSLVNTTRELDHCSAFFDFDNDMDLDLYTSVDKIFTNKLFRNNGNSTFTDVGPSSGAGIIVDAMNTGIGDYDGDGFLDIYITNTMGGSALLKNSGIGTFTDKAEVAGVQILGGFNWGASWIDVDNDRDLDLYVCSSKEGASWYNRFFKNDGSGIFTELVVGGLPNDTLTSYSSAVGDFNQDGFPDIAVSNGNNEKIQLWENTIANNKNFLRLRLKGSLSNGSNINGIGSWIEVYTEGQKQVRFTHTAINYLGQNSLVENIGVGSTTTVDSIIVRWPSGTVDVYEYVLANRYYELNEGQPLPVNDDPFIDVARKWGIEDFAGHLGDGSGVSFADFDQDGWDDLTLGTSSPDSTLFYRNVNGQYFEKLPSLVNHAGNDRQIIWIDTDNDGDLDFFVCNWEATNKLFINNGDLTFTDVSATCGILQTNDATFGASFADFDNDGDLDLFVSNYDTNPGKGNRFYRNNGGNSFEYIPMVFLGINSSAETDFCAIFMDYDNDLDPDLYTVVDKFVYKNKMFRNNANGTFTDVTVASNSGVMIDAMNGGVGDFNTDGYLDIYVTNGPEGNVLLKNDGDGTFTDITSTSGTVVNDACWGACWIDMDADMDLDLYVCVQSEPSTKPNQLYENMGNETFSELVPGGLPFDKAKSYVTAVGDIDNDGRQDIIVSNLYNVPFLLWQNNISNDNNYVKVKLFGTTTNSQGIGSWIEVYTGGQKQVRYTHTSISYIAQNSLTEYIGLGSHEFIDSLIVRWPSLVVDKYFCLDANTTFQATEGTGLINLNALSSTNIWLGGNGICSNPAMWSLGHAPENGETVILRSPNNSMITITNPIGNTINTQDFQVEGNVTFINNGTIVIQSNGGTGLKVFQNAIATNNSDLTIADVCQHAIEVSGTFTNQGTIMVSGSLGKDAIKITNGGQVISKMGTMLSLDPE